MAGNGPAMVWQAPFEPPPPKGPPPTIPLPMTPGQSQMLNTLTPVSPLSQPPGAEYFAKVNFSPSMSSRGQPKISARVSTLHRVSEADSVEEAEGLDQLSGPRFRGPTDDSPVSPHTVSGQETALLDPSQFDLEKASGTGRKGSESSISTLPSRTSPTRQRSARSLVHDDDEPAPFVMRGDKHKRILGIDQKTHVPSAKKGAQKQESSKSFGGPRRKRSFPEINGRSNSPLPGPDVVPFLYQDIEVVFKRLGR